MVRLERRGIATAAVATEPFVDEALEQARVLGMPDYRMVFIAHPVQLLTAEQLHDQADSAFEMIVDRLTGRLPAGRAAHAASESSSGRSSSA
jgi:hypothetical protein